MALDFRADQVRTNKLIPSGSTKTNAGFLVYPFSVAQDSSGNINPSLFSTASIGTDTFLYVSGGSIAEPSQLIGKYSATPVSASVFGGDLVISGALIARNGVFVENDGSGYGGPFIHFQNSLGNWQNILSENSVYKSTISYYSFGAPGSNIINKVAGWIFNGTTGSSEPTNGNKPFQVLADSTVATNHNLMSLYSGPSSSIAGNFAVDMELGDHGYATKGGSAGNATPATVRGASPGVWVTSKDTMGIPLSLEAGQGSGFASASYVRVRVPAQNTSSLAGTFTSENLGEIALFWGDFRFQLPGSTFAKRPSATSANTGSFYFASNTNQLFFQLSSTSWFELTAVQADISASYLVVSNTSSLPNERALLAGPGISFTDGGANGTFGISASLLAGPNIAITQVGSSLAISGTSIADISASYLVVSNTSSLPNERSLVAGPGISFTDGGANGTFGISASLLAGPNITITQTGTSLAISGTTFADVSASYLVIANTSSLPSERAVAAGTGITITDGGANGSVTFAVQSGLSGFTLNSFSTTYSFNSGAHDFSQDANFAATGFIAQSAFSSSLHLGDGTSCPIFYLWCHAAPTAGVLVLSQTAGSTLRLGPSDNVGNADGFPFNNTAANIAIPLPATDFLQIDFTLSTNCATGSNQQYRAFCSLAGVFANNQNYDLVEVGFQGGNGSTVVSESWQGPNSTATRTGETLVSASSQFLTGSGLNQIATRRYRFIHDGTTVQILGAPTSSPTGTPTVVLLQSVQNSFAQMGLKRFFTLTTAGNVSAGSNKLYGEISNLIVTATRSFI